MKASSNQNHFKLKTILVNSIIQSIKLPENGKFVKRLEIIVQAIIQTM